MVQTISRSGHMFNSASHVYSPPVTSAFQHVRAGPGKSGLGVLWREGRAERTKGGAGGLG